MYILYAFLALIPYFGLTVTNKLCSGKTSGFFLSFFKGTLMIPFSFIIVVLLGHFSDLYTCFVNEPILIVYVGISSLLIAANWLLYFVSMKKSTLEAFTPYNMNGLLFGVNLFSLILMSGVVTNGNKTANWVLYILGLCLSVSTIVIYMFNKTVKQGCNKTWTIFCLLGNLSFGLSTALIAKYVGVKVPSDVIQFYQGIGVSVISLVACLVTKDIKDFKKVDKHYVFVVALSALCETVEVVLQLFAVSQENANPAIVSIILAAGLYVVIYIYQLIKTKQKPTPIYLVLFIILVASMILTLLAGII